MLKYTVRIYWLSLCFVGSLDCFGVSDVHVGDSYAIVIKKRGKPHGIMSANEKRMLLYESGSIHLVSNRVDQVVRWTDPQIRDRKMRPQGVTARLSVENQKVVFEKLIEKGEERLVRLTRDREKVQERQDSLIKELKSSQKRLAEYRAKKKDSPDRMSYNSFWGYIEHDNPYDSRIDQEVSAVRKISLAVHQLDFELEKMDAKMKRDENNIRVNKACLERLVSQEPGVPKTGLPSSSPTD